MSTDTIMKPDKRKESFIRYFHRFIAKSSIIGLLCLAFNMGLLLITENSTAQETVAEADSLALVAYYFSTNGDDWVDNSGWLEEPVAFWVGVDEVEDVGDGEWRVTSIDMPRDNMTVPGPFPPELADMDYVEFWKSDVNLHTGGIEVFAEMERLTELLVRTNLLSGPVAWDVFANMPTMEEFRIRQNYFTGQMPSVLGANGEWPVLRRFYLDGNLISGQIPEVTADIQSLNRVYLHNLRLTGPIPDWSIIDELEYYRIAGNNLDEGPIPEWIFDAWGETLVRFQIHNTNRTGSIPQSFTDLVSLEQFIIGGKADSIGEGETTADIPDMQFMPSLRRINFQGGEWTGPLPDWLGNVPNLEDVIFANMDITGPIPANLADPDPITLIQLVNLNIEGGIPAAWQQADGLEALVISDNSEMSIGEIPSFIGGSMGSITTLELSGSGVTGQIPTNLNNLNLSTLNLRDNPDITGDEIPSWLQNKNLSTLELSRTGIELDEIPSWLAQQNSLSYLGLAGLGIQGEIPDFLGQPGLQSLNLNTLALNDNNLTGPIPAALGDLVSLDSLNLANNQLSGEIPVELANAGRITDDLILLEAVILSDNPELTGEIPIEFADAEFMRVFEYDGTDLCEPDNPAYEEWIEGIPDFAAESYPTANFSVQRTQLCTAVSVDGDPTQVYTFNLQNNYPNPFNPSTVIKYEIPEASNVTLTVFNILGQRVATLVNEQKSAGAHQIQFDASNLSSGSYIYRLEAGNHVQSRQMLLIK